MLTKVKTIGIFICLFLADLGYSADTLFVGLDSQPKLVQQKLEFACRFYGLNLESVILSEGERGFKIENALKRSDLRSIVITANALPTLRKETPHNISHRDDSARIPILIIDVNPSINPDILKRWSGGGILNCVAPETMNDGFLRISELEYITRQLKGVNIPFKQSKTCGLILDDKAECQPIIEVINPNSKQALPIFVKIIIDGREFFFQTRIGTSEWPAGVKWQYRTGNFFEIASLLMFLKYSCGERCWHSPGHYANLTIDDPWLIEAYGYLNFKNLLQEMKKARFHTTIGFIPWNFDRSRLAVASIFHENPDRFSIAIHGNNHDHREFYKYEKTFFDPWDGKTLDEQEKNIVQALARMEAFRHFTGISYDRVMIFPHGIGPAKTLGLLKKYSFLATVITGSIK